MKLLLIVALIHAAVGAAVLEKRAKQCGAFCTEQYAPVCGSDGITYSNACFLGIAMCHDHTITLAHSKPCHGHARDTGCAMACFAIYAPVCGTDGNTYTNACFLGIATCNDPTITLAHNTPCHGHHNSRDTTCPMGCYANYDPVCGTDGNTYSNKCMMDSSSCRAGTTVTVAHDGACSGDLLLS